MNADLRGARILIVDDDAFQCRHAASIVKSWGAVPFVAESLASALRLQREAKPDLVLLDVMLPLVDGFKLTHIFRRESETMPIILLSGLGNSESKRRACAVGADEFLTKPVDAFELEIRVSSMLRFKRVADKLEAANRRLLALATMDSLTQLPNRRVLDERLAEEFEHSKRHRTDFACLLLDVDRFKAVNDTWGHPIGDKVLMVVGASIRASIRSMDLGGRFGGEEFMVLARQTGRDRAIAMGETLRREVAFRSAHKGDIPAVTVSIGIATTESGADSAEELVARADSSLYAAKKAGRDCIVCR